MEFEEVVEKRRSVRRFTDDDVPRDIIDRILKIGHKAPSAGNNQAREFIVVRDQRVKSKIVEAALGQSFIQDAPWVVVVCAHEERSASRYGGRGRDLYSIQDATAAVENMLLAVTNEALGSVWVGAFDEEKVSHILDIPQEARPVAILPIGHPAAEPSEPAKMSVKEITHEGMW